MTYANAQESLQNKLDKLGERLETELLVDPDAYGVFNVQLPPTANSEAFDALYQIARNVEDERLLPPFSLKVEVEIYDKSWIRD